LITNEKLILHGPVLTSVSGRDVEAVNVRKISYPANVVTFGIEVWRGAGGVRYVRLIDFCITQL